MALQKRSSIIILFVSVAVISIGAAIFYKKVLYKEHEKIEEKAVFFSGSSEELKSKVASNPNELVNKTVEIRGEVSGIENQNIILASSIFCQLKDSLNEVKTGQNLVIKARYIGYDDLMEEIKLDQCIIIK